MLQRKDEILIKNTIKVKQTTKSFSFIYVFVAFVKTKKSLNKHISKH
jgi:hypothetical protein